MKRGFTLLEVLVALAVVALGPERRIRRYRPIGPDRRATACPHAGPVGGRRCAHGPAAGRRTSARTGAPRGRNRRAGLVGRVSGPAIGRRDPARCRSAGWPGTRRPGPGCGQGRGCGYGPKRLGERSSRPQSRNVPDLGRHPARSGGNGMSSRSALMRRYEPDTARGSP